MASTPSVLRPIAKTPSWRRNRVSEIRRQQRSLRAFLAAAAIVAGCVTPTTRAAEMMSGDSAKAGTAASAPQISAADRTFFEAKIRPVLAAQCYKCHSREADKVKGGLLLDSHDGMIQGGNSGPAVEPGKPDTSLLLRAIQHADEDLKMPPKGDKLSDSVIADFSEWIRRGAPFPAPLATAAQAPGAAKSYGGVGRNHWAFQPVKVATPPAVKDATWARSPVDTFVLAKLEAAGLKPNADADKRTLIRRVSYDLIGLPPTDEEMKNFLTDTSPDAFAKVVDRLLASPHYGEHWGRYWLDVARYADTKGDAPRRDDPRYPYAWTYRDWVIDAFNQDLPYDQFITAQLAADLVQKQDIAAMKTAAGRPNTPNPPSATAVKIDQSSLAALGFLTLGPKFDGRIDDIISDRVDVTTKAFLGLTVACARCHDHKFDPIPQKDFYSLYGIFANTTEPRYASELPTVHAVPRSTALEDYLQKAQELQAKEIDVRTRFQQARRAKELTPDKRREFQRAEIEVQRDLLDLEYKHPGAVPRAMALIDVPKSRDYPLLIRGEVNNKGEIVPRRFLEVLSPDPKNRPAYKTGSGRLELARAIASPTNPMTARVLVNRIWQEHFGSGFVETPDDLGNMSTPPTHPELLDWLANQFVAGGWSIKQLHRTIVLSRTYQLSSLGNPKYADIDPNNHLHWRFNLRRLDFEQLHDGLLQEAGLLDRAVGGKPVPIGSSEFASRRAIYTYIDRANPAELLTQFDFPSPSVASGRRYETIVPQQSLFLMNSAMVTEVARRLVKRPEFQALADERERVESLYLAIFQRPPTAEETKLCVKYIKANPGGASDAPPVETPQSRQAARAAQREARRAELAMNFPRAKNAYQPEPGGAAFTDRTPLDAWTKLAHALYQTNEAMFVN